MTAERKKKDECELLIWNVPLELKNKFKARCALLKITMRDAIIDFMTKFSK